MPRRKAFTLVETLTVLGIISLLAAIIFPAFATVRGKARQATCLSNLKQIGSAVSMYMQDSDGRYPRAVDPYDHTYPAMWGDYPDFSRDIAAFPLLQTALQPYAKSTQIFSCPADTGFDKTDFADEPLAANPTSFEKFGTSYYYRTELAALNKGELAIQNLEVVNLLFDGKGAWHGTWVPPTNRFNCLFADFHVKNIGQEQMDQTWLMPIGK